MGMSIDEATRILHNFDGLSLTDEDELSEAIRKAIDIMRKYQKIVEIMADKKDDGGVFEMEDSYWLDKISEVLEDGENNNN